MYLQLQLWVSKMTNYYKKLQRTLNIYFDFEVLFFSAADCMFSDSGFVCLRFQILFWGFQVFFSVSGSTTKKAQHLPLQGHGLCVTFCFQFKLVVMRVGKWSVYKIKQKHITHINSKRRKPFGVLICHSPTQRLAVISMG